MKRLAGSLVVALLLAFGGGAVHAQSGAQTIAFNELLPGPLQNPILGTVTCVASGSGFEFSSTHFHVHGPNFDQFTSNGTSNIGYENNRGPVLMSRVGAGTFSLNSVDLAEFSANAAIGEADFVQIDGTQADDTVVTVTVALDGVRDGLGGVQDFQHFVLPGTFTDLRSVSFTGIRAGQLTGGLSIDNVDYTLSVAEALPLCSFAPNPAEVPQAQMTSPGAGATVSGSVTVSADATDNVAVTTLRFKVDGTDIGTAFTSAPYTMAWDSTTVNDGTHVISVDAADANGHHGTAQVTVTVQNHTNASNDPHYLEFDGVDDFVSVADSGAFSFGTATADLPFTLEAWMRPDAMTRNQIIGKWGDTANKREWKLAVVSGFIQMGLYDASTAQTVWGMTSASQTGLVGAWHHVAVTYDGRGGSTAANGITIYIDGVAMSMARQNSATYVAMENTIQPLSIGREGPSWFQFDGGLDEIRVWNVARTLAQIQVMRTTEIPADEPGLVAYWRFNDGSGSTTGDTTNGDHWGQLTNGPFWMPGGPLAPVVVDTTAPVISNVATSNLTSTAVTISFTTNESTTGVASWVAGAACPCTDATDVVTSTVHTITLSGLAPSTLHTFTVKATDVAGNPTVGPTATFTTLAPPPDLTNPTVVFTTPTGGNVTGTLNVQATATDNVGVVSVQFLLDGQPLGTLDTTAPHATSWDTTTATEGIHVLTAEARDAANNLGTASVTVNVANLVVQNPHYVKFDGVDDFVQLADADAFTFSTGTADLPFTVETWLRPDTMTRNQVIGKFGGTAGTREWKLAVVSGFIQMSLYDATTAQLAWGMTSSVQTALTGAWHHLAVTYDGRGGATAANGITMYVDGIAVPMVRQNSATYVAMRNTTQPIWIGHEGPTYNQYKGGMDDVRIWSLVRTGAEINALRASELTGVEPGLVGYWKFNEGTGATAADDSPNDTVATFQLGAAWGAGGPLGAAVVDTTAPVISGLSTSSVTSTSAVIGFTTDEATTASVAYVAGISCPCSTVNDPTSATVHAISLTGLTPNTLYSFTVTATDAAGNPTTATTLSFSTLAPPPDTTNPVVTMVRPTGGNVVGTILVQANPTDNVGVVSVQFLLDGQPLGALQTAAPWQMSWDTTTAAEGLHTITAQALDAANNLGTVTVNVTVANLVPHTPFYLEFDGVDDFVQVADQNGLTFSTGTADQAFTLETWIRPDVMTRNQLLGKWGDTQGTREWKLAVVSGFVQLMMQDASTGAQVFAMTSTAQTGLVGAWHHIAVSYDGRGGSTAANGVTIYIDGVAASMSRQNSATYVAMRNTPAPLSIGREGPSWNRFDGGMDDVRIWNVARSAAEIAAARSAELSGSESGLVGYWRFNGGSGTSAVNDATTGAGTLTNGVVWVAGGPLP